MDQWRKGMQWWIKALTFTYFLVLDMFIFVTCKDSLISPLREELVDILHVGLWQNKYGGNLSTRLAKIHYNQVHN